jgi:long-chain fatty acid transport protein
VIAIIFAALFALSSLSYLEAADIRPFELGARAAALGGAFVTRTDDSSSIFYNPSALAFSTGIMVKTNFFYPKTNTTAENPGISSSFSSEVGKIRGSAFVSWNIKERIGLGLGVFFPHAMETQWLWSWPGRYISIRSKLNTLYVRPTVAVKITNFLSAGAGIDFISSNMQWNYDRIFTFQEPGFEDGLEANSDSRLEAKGLGYVVGALIRISNNLRLGGRFQPKVRLDFDGRHQFVFEQTLSNPGHLQATTSSFTLPREFVIGAMYSPLKNLIFQIDFQRLGMSEIKKWEFDLDPEIYDAIQDFYGARPDEIKQGIDLSMKDISRIMIGVEFLFKNNIALRVGYTNIISASAGQIIHPVFPDLETNIMSFGIGYDGPTFSVWDTFEKQNGISLDAYFQYRYSPKSISALPEFPVVYRANGWTVGIGVGVTFGSY